MRPAAAAARRLFMVCLVLGGPAGLKAQTLDGLAVPRGLAGIEGVPSAGMGTVFEPRISADAVWSDNAKLSSGSKRSELTTTLSPGLRWTANGQRLKGSVDYSLTRLKRWNSSEDETRNSLRSQARLEAVEDRVFVDYSGTISQNAISAFGQQSADDYGLNPNRTEVRTFRLSPYVQGRMGDWANYQLRYSVLTSRSKANVASDQDSHQWLANMRSASGRGRFNWSFDAIRDTADFQSGREVEADQLRLVLGYRVTPELNLAILPGWESNNYASLDKQSQATIGASVDWAVERTRLSATVENRFFGRSHALSLEHRTPRTAWKFQDTKAATVSPQQFGTINLGSLYDILYFQFESIEPDPVRRAALVESFLLANGLNGQTAINTGVQSSGATLQRRQDLSVTLIGLRETLSLLASQNRASSLFQSSSDLLGDFSNSNFVRQQSFSLNYARRLQPGTSMNVVLTFLRSLGSLDAQSTTLRTLNVSFTTQLSRQMSGSIGLRRAEFDSPAAPYTENSIRGGVTVRF